MPHDSHLPKPIIYKPNPLRQAGKNLSTSILATIEYPNKNANNDNNFNKINSYSPTKVTHPLNSYQTAYGQPEPTKRSFSVA
jgi:hypothetical protein